MNARLDPGFTRWLLTLLIAVSTSASAHEYSDAFESRCHWINGVYDDSGVVLSSFFQNKSSIIPEVGMSVSMAMYVLHHNRPVEKVKLAFDESNNILFVRDAGNQDAIIVRHSASCVDGKLIIRDENDLHSDGHSFHQTSVIHFIRVDAKGVELQWSVENQSRQFLLFQHRSETRGTALFKQLPQ